jgi:hypothetical protein
MQGKNTRVFTSPTAVGTLSLAECGERFASPRPEGFAGALDRAGCGRVHCEGGSESRRLGI